MAPIAPIQYLHTFEITWSGIVNPRIIQSFRHFTGFSREAPGSGFIRALFLIEDETVKKCC